MYGIKFVLWKILHGDVMYWSNDSHDASEYDAFGYNEEGFNKEGIYKLTGTKYTLSGCDPHGFCHVVCYKISIKHWSSKNYIKLIIYWNNYIIIINSCMSYNKWCR